jgi:hypothetical protein
VVAGGEPVAIQPGAAGGLDRDDADPVKAGGGGGGA